MDTNIEEYNREQEKLKEELEKKYGKPLEEVYAEREKRTNDVIDLKVPDRVPLSLNANPAKFTEIPQSALYYDPLAYKKANRQLTVAFEPDLCNAGLPNSGATWDALGVTNRLWPGGNLPEDYEYQFMEKEFLKEDEYDEYFYDPTGFMIRKFLPRMYTSLIALEELPPLDLIMSGFEGLTSLLVSPGFQKAARAIQTAGEENKKFREMIGDAAEDLADLGFPPFFSMLGASGIGGAPFDTVSSFLRGMQGSMTDMFRQPEKLLKLCDMIMDRRIALATAPGPDKRGYRRRVGMPLWRGDKSFMSQKQFEKFYWPGLKRALQAVSDLGGIPIPFFEAEFGERLERLLELPKGTVVASIEYVDLKKAREILRDHHCIFVRGPFSLQKATPQQVIDCYKDMFDKYGKGGGIFFNIRLPDGLSIEEVQGMVKEIRDYVRY
ncbi:MAG: hypothetical protein JW712_05640 [Dehalococcoidales bacterium]|nr:hypothetical protein [Dehalococcoidales bacterium]